MHVTRATAHVRPVDERERLVTPRGVRYGEPKYES
jgi:hypothetical protein